MSRRRAAGTVLALLVGAAGPLWSAGGQYAASGHGNTRTGVLRARGLYGRGECGHCHEAHASQDAPVALYPYALFAREEKVCWTCHDGTVAQAADARLPFSTTPANTATDYYKHPVSNLMSGFTPSAHRFGESSPTAFAGGNRHAECTDCHNPHAARNNGSPGQSLHTPGGPDGNRLSGALLGAPGIVVSAWPNAGAPFSGAAHQLGTLDAGTTSYEWQVCFTCHSSFTTLPTYSAVGSGDFTASKITSLRVGQVREYQDVGQAFNPNNLSYHPVVAQGRNASIPAGSFVSPWSAIATLYCSDCHNRASGGPGAAGPHGSSHMHLLERPLRLRENTHHRDPSWGADLGHDPNELCFKCHRWQTYVQKAGDPVTNTNFRRRAERNLHAEHLGKYARGATCYTCHDVHGANKQHLINLNLDTVTAGSGSQGAYTHTGAGGSCSLTCHGEQHQSRSYSR